MFKKRFIPKIEYESCTFITDLVDRRYSPMINREKKGVAKLRPHEENSPAGCQ